MSEDITKQPNPPHRPETPAQAAYDPFADRQTPLAFPWQILAAGTLWIFLGAGVLVVAITVVVLLAYAANAAGPNRPGPSSTLVGAFVVFGLCALSFIFSGVQHIRGAARRVMASSVSSICLALYLTYQVVLRVVEGRFNYQNLTAMLFTIGEAAACILLLAAGVLALWGKKQYEAWRTLQLENSFQRTRSSTQIATEGDEWLLREGLANLFQGWNSVGGWLYLTNQRLVFRPRALNFWKQENSKFTLNKNELSIPLAEIQEVKPFASGGIIPGPAHEDW